MGNRVRKLDLGVVPEAAISGGMLVATEYSTLLLFNAMQPVDGDRRVPAGVAVLVFEAAALCRFGLPNDEARPGHPVLGTVDAGYEILEVDDSEWRDEAERQNRVKFPSSDFRALRHFIVAMHDSTFECLARGVSVEVFDEPYDDVVAEVVGRALAE
ncbi:MAG: hypothetical protein ACE5FP_02430 [Gemmatimonadota bacterium]